MITVNLMTRKLRNIIKARLWRTQNLDRAKATRALYQTNHPEAHLKSNQAYRAKHSKRYKELNRKSNLRRNGWTTDRVEMFKVNQRNACAICGKFFEGNDMDADHEHTIPPKPRGLLCGLCNKGLGQFKDDPILLENAAIYLRKWGK